MILNRKIMQDMYFDYETIFKIQRYAITLKTPATSKMVLNQVGSLVAMVHFKSEDLLKDLEAYNLTARPNTKKIRDKIIKILKGIE
jgi:hypothetical protein